MCISLYRKQKRMTQNELAQLLNVDRSTVAKWENGKSLPRTEILIKLADLFGCTIDELVRGEKK